MTLEEFYKELPGEDWCSVVVRKFVGELIQDVNQEEILAFWWNEDGASNDIESKMLYYIVTNKRFFEVRVESDSFSYKSYFLKHLSSFKEKVIPHNQEPYAFKNSIYFADGSEGVSCYKVKFSFSFPGGKSNTKTVMFSASESWENSRLQKLREFVKGFHKAVTNL